MMTRTDIVIVLGLTTGLVMGLWWSVDTKDMQATQLYFAGGAHEQPWALRER